jgi:Holliday junction resolvase RusA-like endonuclease
MSAPLVSVGDVLVDLFIPEEPVAKARPRVTGGRGRAHAYSTPKCAAAEDRIRACARAELGDGFVPLTEALSLSVIAFRAVPTVVPKRLLDTALPTQRPDLDNYLKLIVDALTLSKATGWGVWRDDAQIVDIHTSKRYAVYTTPGWQVLITSPNMSPMLNVEAIWRAMLRRAGRGRLLEAGHIANVGAASWPPSITSARYGGEV